MKLRKCVAVFSLVCCIAAAPVQAGYVLGGALIGTGIALLGAGGVLVGLGKEYTQNAAQRYNTSELVVTGYDVNSSGCTLCLPGGTTGLDGPCFPYTYNARVDNNYTAYSGGVYVTEKALTGSYCGDNPDQLLADAENEYPLGSRTGIFYRIDDPEKWAYSLSDLDPYSGWSALPFAAGTISVLGGIVAIGRECHRRTYGQYQEIK